MPFGCRFSQRQGSIRVRSSFPHHENFVSPVTPGSPSNFADEDVMRFSSVKKIKCIMLVLSIVACRASRSVPIGSDLVSDSPYLTERPLLMVANVENAFDGEDQGTEYPDFKTGSSNWDQEMAEGKALRVAKVFHAANCPEIVVSPEVENQVAADMIAKAAIRCKYKAYSANTEHKFPIGVAIFTSKRVVSTGLVDTGYRPHLRVDFDDGLSLIGVHFKSQRDGGEDKRLMAAQAIKKEIARKSARRLIAAGDFNTEDDLLAGTGLTNCTRSAKPTHVFRGEWHQLDKIYATHCGDALRLDVPFLFKDDNTPFRSVMRKDGGQTTHRNEGYSDHIPLVMMK